MKKRLLIALVGLALVIGATTGSVFALTGDGSGNEDQDVADEWKLVEASGWMGGFSIRLPRGWQLNELQGIDSYVGEIVGGGVRLTLDFGWYSSSLVDDDDPQYIVTYEEIGGRGAKLVLPGGEGEGLITGVYFENFDGSDLETPSQNRLQISGVDLTPDQQETALAIFRTIRPLASEPQGEPEPSDVPSPSAGCVEDVPDCNDTPVIGPDEEGTIEPDFGEDGPYPVPNPDIACGPDQGVAITPDGQVSCLDLGNPGQTDDGEDMVSPGNRPAVEPAQ